MKLTNHFTLAEFVVSQEATRRGIPNVPPPVAIANMKRTAEMLEQVRALAGRPITLTSGFRSPTVNKLVGGSANSAHVKGLAADIICSGLGSRELARMIRDSDIEFDQLIMEGTWVHIALRDGPLRREVLTATFKNGIANYSKGIA